MHLDLDDTVSGAGLAAAALYIETEAPLLIALALGVCRRREQIPDLIEDSGIGGRIGTGRPSNGRLVDGDHLIQLLHTDDFLITARNGSGPVQLSGQCLIQNLIDLSLIHILPPAWFARFISTWVRSLAWEFS